MNDSSERAKRREAKTGIGKQGISTTIVGGRPNHGDHRVRIPVGIQVLMKKAAVDPAFRELLLGKRGEAAREIGLQLSPAETAMLKSIPRSQIERIVENTTVPDPQRRAFLGKMGTAMVAALGLGLSGCESEPMVLGITVESRPTSTAMPTASTEMLDVSILDEQPNSATVSVSYQCPFETGRITIYLKLNPRNVEADLTYQPAQSVDVARGSGEITFTAYGTSRIGITKWLVVRLLSTSEQCLEAQRNWPSVDYTPGEFFLDNCVVWKVVEYRKVWTEE